jgi:glycosyltransferase involved in cell wall biosynthesis
MQCKVGICLKNQPESMLVSHERKFFEYISISLPSVFCNSKIYTDVLNKYQIGIAVNLANSNEIALAIEKLFEDTEFYKNCLLSCGQAAHNEYNWEFEALKLIQLYNKLLLN